MISRLAIAAAWVIALSLPADARLQLSISANGGVFHCFDGELGCDLSGGANNLLVVDTSVGGAFVQIELAQSAFGSPNELQLSSDSILNTTLKPITITLLASDTSFTPPAALIRESASLTFNTAVGSPASFLQFWADAANAQGANFTNTPGALLDTVFGTPTSDPDSFSGTHFVSFAAGSPFSMTEGASLNLIGGASVTGFNESMQTTVPEPRTYLMLAIGFGLMALFGRRRRRPIIDIA